VGIVSGGGGGGGLPLTGGTLTGRLTVNAAVTKLLDLINSPTLSTWEVDVFQSDLGGGRVDALIEARGEGTGNAFVRLRNGTGDSNAHVGSDQITLDSNSNTPTDVLVDVTSVWWGTLLTILADHTQVGAPMKFSFPPTLQNHSAPSDGSLAAGDCALWFDQTDGTAALNVKAKQANGTVKTATIPVIT
jgi:hypothetical protein